MLNNIIAIYKPKGPTSHDIIDEIRKITGERRVGHAGTLDPLARGVLVIGIGRDATKKLSEVVKKEKEYIAEITFGVESLTDDAEGEKTQRNIKESPSRETIEKILAKFIGKIQQTPPIFSALKIKGESAYRKARRGEKIKLKPREVEIKSVEVLKYEWPRLMLKVITGPGVYIRALARDLGQALGVGGYLSDLERTRVGEFKKEDALNLNQLRN
ncbi:MAG: tRNA pseudouridine synthase B [Parcubacteria group bacterium GW2011_GWA2_45_30]|nr:MAG: tRNA pseudouridine synthase B [Parcubacteria group bacterium GW2011_GWA2_45_30]